MSTLAGQTPIDKALLKIADLIVERMEALKGSGWQKPWFNTSYRGAPQNITGRSYAGMNELILDFVTSAKEHALPVFMTFNQATKEGVHVNKGAKSVPVLYYEHIYKDEAGKRVPDHVAKTLSEEERSQLKFSAVLKKFDVFNIDDTNFKEVKPELYEQFKKQYAVPELKDTQGMYANKELDRMFAKQEWLCPIDIKNSEGAFYSPHKDSITLPLKAQFQISSTSEGVYRDGMEFYSTAIHEMTHSTGSATRLNRDMSGRFGDPRYAKEELVAELTSAVVGRSMGFDRQISDNSAKYLNNWVGALREEPRFVLSVLGDVSKASSLIMGEVEKQRVALQQTPQEQSQDRASADKLTANISDATLVKMRNGDYAVRASADGKDTGFLSVSKQDAVAILSQSNSPQKTQALEQLVHKALSSSLLSLGQEPRSLSPKR